MRKMIPNCKGCQEEYDFLIKCAKCGLHFAGEGLHEYGHLLLRMVDEKGRVMVS